MTQISIHLLQVKLKKLSSDESRYLIQEKMNFFEILLLVKEMLEIARDFIENKNSFRIKNNLFNSQTI